MSNYTGNFLTFGEATKAAQNGEKIAREGWNGMNMFAYIIPQHYKESSNEIERKYFGDGVLVEHRAKWALKTAQNDIASWTPSGSDTLARDWYIVE